MCAVQWVYVCARVAPATHRRRRRCRARHRHRPRDVVGGQVGVGTVGARARQGLWAHACAGHALAVLSTAPKTDGSTIGAGIVWARLGARYIYAVLQNVMRLPRTATTTHETDCGRNTRLSANFRIRKIRDIHKNRRSTVHGERAVSSCGYKYDSCVLCSKRATLFRKGKIRNTSIVCHLRAIHGHRCLKT